MGTAEVPHQRFGIGPALRARGGRCNGSRFRNLRTRAIAVHATGRGIGERLRETAPSQGAEQGLGTQVSPPLGLVLGGGRRRQVDDACGQARQPGEAGRVIQVTRQGRDTATAQEGRTLGAGGQRQQPDLRALHAGHAQADIAATDDQEALAAKARGQGAEGTLV